ncbi:hypothetical protein RM844_17005 [Streptomyces sp. DSM 44915]|uniref:Head-to-tail stopper n=1 Tax=Streptomyces chisholmiae TaxID=3075540 RepID=A0ABU2JT96_9ACTN|nr:hypothetical protein [Streptomyces sp. DSM 44915]MDT0267981.1 hypothetical protein [Streptomyces sp. DSM 44915]
MSLLDQGPELVTIYPTVPSDDGYGGTQPGPGEPVRVQARVMPADTDEAGEAGYLSPTTYRVYARSLPAGPWSRVEWRGEVWSVVGEVEHFGGSRRIAFDAATIRKRS